MGFFSGGTSTQDTFSGLRGLGTSAYDMANFLVPTVQKGANAGYNMFINPEASLQNGLYASQAGLLPNLVSMAGSKMSAQAGARGQMSPENVGAIAGSAAQNLAPFLMPLMGQNISDIRNSGGNIFASMLGTGANALGSESHSKTTSNGIGYNWANAFGNNLFGEFGKSLGGRIGGGASLPSGLGG